MFKDFFKQPISLLKEEDLIKLRDLERVAYMDEAEKLIKERGKNQAKKDYEIKEGKKDGW